ncbi:MAG: hypothetical protein M1829_003501 [Trizodia sp. TS-e1964]|nr:MAG: hypothetical protein M1829_003501 [Trizodia sp. TS-e1964]
MSPPDPYVEVLTRSRITDEEMKVVEVRNGPLWGSGAGGEPATMQTNADDSWIYDSPSHIPLQHIQRTRAVGDFSKSMPLGTTRPALTKYPHSRVQGKATTTVVTTPLNYKLVKPLPQAFMSTGLLTKRHRSPEEHHGGIAAKMPDTPCKRNFNNMPPPASPARVLGLSRHLQRTAGSTPFQSPSRRTAQTPGGGTLGKSSINIFSDTRHWTKLSRQASFSSIEDGYHSDNSPPPPTPTKRLCLTSAISEKGSPSLRPQTRMGDSPSHRPLASRRDMGNASASSPERPWGLSDTPASPKNTPWSPSRAKSHENRPTNGSLSRLSWTSPAVSASPKLVLRGTPRSLLSSKSAGVKRGSLSDMPWAPPAPASTTTEFSLWGIPAMPSSPPNAAWNSASSVPASPKHSSPWNPPSACDSPKHPSTTPGSPNHLAVAITGGPFISIAKQRHLQRNSPQNRSPQTPHTPQQHTFPLQFTTSPELDTSLLKRFKSVALVGSGVFSHVFRVTQESPGFGVESPASAHKRQEVFAVKRPKKTYSSNREYLQQKSEADILKELVGAPHVIQYVDSWSEGNRIYLQTELCEDGSLDKFLADAGRKSRLDDFRIWKILLELAMGINSIHEKGFMHLDLKPSNVLITFEGCLKIADFGMAVKWPATSEPEHEGDREYLAPEILTNGTIDKPADVFSLGIILFEVAGNVMLPECGSSWQKLRAGDISDVPSLTWSSSTQLSEAADAVGLALPSTSISAHTSSSLHRKDKFSFSFEKDWSPHTRGGFSSRHGELADPPAFMTDAAHDSALEKVVGGMLRPTPATRPVASQILEIPGVVWVAQRRRAGATIFEGNWGPADTVLSDDEEMVLI